jgi:hypothetical protein
MDKLVNYILGLEPDLWHTISCKEKSRYKILVFCFIAFVALSLSSSIFLVYMISSNRLLAMGGGLMLTFVTFNIVRFSLVILRRSVYPKVIESENEEIALVDSKVIDSKAKQIINKGLTLIRSTFNFQNLIPGLGSLVRIVILSTMCLLVVFPLTCFMHSKQVDAICNAERTVLLNNFKEQNESILRTQLKGYERQIFVLDQELLEAENIGIQNLSLAKNKAIERETLKNKMQESKAEFEITYSLRYNKYFESISKRYFLVKCFTAATQFGSFSIVLIWVFGLVIFSHMILIGLKNKTEYQYASLSTDFYRSQIEVDYKVKQSYLDTFLKKKYPELYPSLHKTSMYANPPYCNIKNKFFNPRSVMDKTEFENSFNVN